MRFLVFDFAVYDWYTMSGTEIAYQAECERCLGEIKTTRIIKGMLLRGVLLRAPYAMSGTHILYAPTRRACTPLRRSWWDPSPSTRSSIALWY
eukprot:3803773-Rhodomonas_salina.1